jgi:YD repeat-containing protein
LGPGDAYKSYSPCTVRQNQDAHPLIQDEAIAWVVDPAGNKVVQHYNVWPGNPGHPQYAVISPDGLRKFDYGLPIGALNTSTNLHLSREVMTGCATNGNCTNTVRRTYQRYHFDPATFSPTGETGEFHKTIEAERTEYLDDEVSSGVPRYAQVDYSGYDGFGHYRTSTTSGTFEGNNVRISTTNFNPGSNDRAKGSNGLLAIKVNEPWILGTYDSATVSEGAATETTKACFDKTTGWLRAVRTGDQNNQRDLITLFTPETSGGASNGNIARETFYGGDGSPLNSSAATQALCAIADGGNPGSIGYRILHTYTYGQRATSKYENMPFFSLNQQIELSGVITKTWDTDGDLATTYSYDRAGRLTKIEPPGLAATTYAYTNASSSSGVFAPARVNATISSSTGGAIETEYQYDAFGRFWRQKDLLRQVGQTKYWSLRETNYDALDRKISISEPEEVSGTDPSTTAHKTEFLNYDAFGRARTVKAPDNSDTTLEFKGDSTTKRTVRIATGSTTDTDAITTETYDRHGRLITVTEPAPEGALTTSYGYDVRNRLSLVLMGGQNRTFDYDRRGFLRWESHPESGMTTYTYDARGHVLSKSQSAADTLYDLTYQYDAAERPLVIRGRNPFFDPAAPNDPDEPQFRVMKKFTYGTSNVASPADRRLGKLWTAVRYNYDPNGSDDTYKVTETYLYGDTAGRKTKRTTVITTGTGVDETWWDTYRTVDTELEYNDLNLVKTVKYPSCVGCGTWNGSVPVREQTYGYTSGKLTTAPGFVDGLTYWPNGMWHTMQRNNGMLDTQEIETSTAMPRPKSISSKPSFECAPVTITSEPVGGTVTSTNPVTLSVAVSGTGDFSYEWWNAETDQIVGWDATFTATTSNTPVTTAYTVTVKNGCNSVAKATAIATVNECIAPTAGAGFEINGDGTYTLIAGGSGTEPRTYAWRRTSDQSLIGTGRKVTVGPLTSSTTYTVTIGNSCTALPSTANVTVTIKSPMMAVLSATRIDASRIHVAWTGAAIGTSYDLQRRSGPAWSTIVSLSPATSSTGGLDDTVPTAGTYAYRLVDPNGSVSNADVASTTPPTTAVSGAKITASTFAALLSTVNSVRAAVGWPPVTWANILSSNDPLPAPGAVILSVHLTSTRARMNEALQALGVPTGAYTKGTVKGIRIEAADLNEVVVRAY